MRLALIALLMICNLAIAQMKVTTHVLLDGSVSILRINGINKNYQVGIGMDFNRTFSTNLILGMADNTYYYHPPDFGYSYVLRYAELHLGAQYRILPKKAFSPVLEFALGRGFKSKTSTGVVYFDAHGAVLSEESEFSIGSFMYIKSSFEFEMLCDYSIKNISLQLGGGVASKVIIIDRISTKTSDQSLQTYRGPIMSIKIMYRLTRKAAKDE